MTQRSFEQLRRVVLRIDALRAASRQPVKKPVEEKPVEPAVRSDGRLLAQRKKR